LEEQLRGRPPKAFALDPDRHLMACAVAYWALGSSRRGGCEIAVASMEGWPIGPRRKRGAGGHGLNLLNLEFELRTPWCATASIAGRARGLRQKIKKALKDPSAAAWLQEMGQLFLLALGHGTVRDPAAAAVEIMRRAKELGETDFARDRLLPLRTLTSLTPRKSAASDLFTPFVNEKHGVRTGNATPADP
jgi:hypothetical protein